MNETEIAVDGCRGGAGDGADVKPSGAGDRWRVVPGGVWMADRTDLR